MKKFTRWETLVLAMLMMLLSISCGCAESDSDAEDSEESLRWLLSDITGQEAFEEFYYGDYDDDGIHEAFAFVGEKNDFLLEGDLWFVSPIFCEPVQEERSYLYMSKEGEAAPMLFTAEEGYGGSKSTSHLWTVIASRPQEVSLGQFEGFTYGGNNVFYVNPSEFDMFSDGTGHTWKTYYYFLDGLTMREYGGIYITLDELLEFEGADVALAQAIEAGYEIQEIIYRGNGIINVNLRQDQGSIYRNEYLTLHYDETSVVSDGLGDGGIYALAYTPDRAVYPSTFVHPQGKGSSLEDIDRLLMDFLPDEDEFFYNGHHYYRGNYPYSIGTGEVDFCWISYYDGQEKDLVLPSSLHVYDYEMPLGAITYEAFVNNEYLESVVIPEGVTDIGEKAFYGCKNLKKVVLPSTISMIDGQAFANCENLTEVVLPEDVFLYRVAEDAFDDCPNLTLTGRQQTQFTDTETAADAAQQAAFATDTQNLTELSDYIGTDLYTFVGMFDDMEDCDYSDGIGYRNKDIEVYSSWMMDDVLIDRISINRKANYCLCGIYVGMDLQQAREMLLSEGWIETEPTSWGMYFENARKDSLILEHNESQWVEALWLEADYSLIETWYNEDEYDDASYEESAGTGYTTDDVNLRIGPGLGYESIGTIPSGMTVEYLGDQSVDDRGVVWYYIQYGDKVGWGSSKYVKCD